MTRPMGRPRVPVAAATEERLRRLGAAAAAAEAVAEDAREARDKAIEEADLQGVPILRIAELAGISRSRADAIVKARTAARQARLRQAAGLGDA